MRPLMLTVRLEILLDTTIIQLTEGCDIAAPEVLPFEIGNALTAMMKKGTLHLDEIQTSWEIIQRIPVELRRIDIKSALNIAARFNLGFYIVSSQNRAIPWRTCIGYNE